MTSVNKAFILGAGLGTRLRPLTDSLPKPLVPLYHEPMANHALRHCQQAGIHSFAINTHHLPEAWPQAYPRESFEGSPLRFFHEQELLETGGGIKNIADFIGEDALLVYNGDILTDLDLKGLIEAHQRSGNVATLALFSDGPNCNVAVDGDRVVDLRHARGIHPGTHQFTGIYCIEPEILDLIPANEKVSIVPAFLTLAEKGKIGAFFANGASWHDLGTREAYFDAHRHLREGAQAIHSEAEIHPEADIEEITCVIGPKCVVAKGAKLRNTILWPGAKVAEYADLDGCIVRSHAEGTHRNADL